MKRPIYDIETDCDININIQVTTPFIDTENGKQLLPDGICIVAEDYDHDNDKPIETVILLSKTQALILAEKILNLAISIKTPEILKSK